MTKIVEHLGEGVDLSPPTMDESTLTEAERHFKIEQELLKSLRGRTE
jgi:hypothetical protein